MARLFDGGGDKAGSFSTSPSAVSLSFFPRGFSRRLLRLSPPPSVALFLYYFVAFCLFALVSFVLRKRGTEAATRENAALSRESVDLFDFFVGNPKIKEKRNIALSNSLSTLLKQTNKQISSRTQSFTKHTKSRPPLPPHNGFGSEEDSANSCQGLSPRARVRRAPAAADAGVEARFPVRLAGPEAVPGA